MPGKLESLTELKVCLLGNEEGEERVPLWCLIRLSPASFFKKKLRVHISSLAKSLREFNEDFLVFK